MISSLTPLHREQKIAMFQPVTCWSFCEKSRGNDVLHQLEYNFHWQWKRFGNMWSTTNHHGKITIRVSGMDLRPQEKCKTKKKNSPSTLSPKKRPQAVKGLFLRQEKMLNPFNTLRKKSSKMKNENKKRPRSIASLESYKNAHMQNLSSQPVWMMSVAIPSQTQQKGVKSFFSFFIRADQSSLLAASIKLAQPLWSKARWKQKSKNPIRGWADSQGASCSVAR